MPESGQEDAPAVMLHWQQPACSWELQGSQYAASAPEDCARRKNHAVAAVGEDIWLFGGVTVEGFSADLLQLRARPCLHWCHVIAEGQQQPTPTVLHSMVAMDLSIVVFGGLVELVEPPPVGGSARGSDDACSSSSGSAAGSTTRALSTNMLWLLHTDEPRWNTPVTTGRTPSARIGHAAAARSLGGGAFQMYVFGGFDQSEGRHLNDISFLSVPEWSWSQPT